MTNQHPPLSELLPCPFCGGKPTEPERITQDRQRPMYEIGCRSMFCCNRRGRSQKEVRMLWNTRPNQPRGPDVEALENKVDDVLAPIFETGDIADRRKRARKQANELCALIRTALQSAGKAGDVGKPMIEIPLRAYWFSVGAVTDDNDKFASELTNKERSASFDRLCRENPNFKIPAVSLSVNRSHEKAEENE